MPYVLQTTQGFTLEDPTPDNRGRHLTCGHVHSSAGGARGCASAVAGGAVVRAVRVHLTGDRVTLRNPTPMALPEEAAKWLALPVSDAQQRATPRAFTPRPHPAQPRRRS